MIDYHHHEYIKNSDDFLCGIGFNVHPLKHGKIRMLLKQTTDSHRYAKQIILPEIGIEGQKKIFAAKILCVGAGGLGSPALIYLATAGVGTLGIIDHDVVEISNLHRQILFSTDSVGEKKVSAAASQLLKLNPEIAIREYDSYLNAENALTIMKDYDVIIDATDNFTAKYLINDAAVKLEKPVIYGAISGFSGQVSVFFSKQGPCYRCLFPIPPKTKVFNCAESGIMGAIAGMIGSLQAMEALKIILGEKHCQQHHLTTLIGRLYTVDLASMQTNVFDLKKRTDCSLCQINKDEIVLPNEKNISCNLHLSVEELFFEDAIQQKNVVFIDVREPHEWENGKIDEAIRLPLSKIDNDISVFEPFNLNANYVVYCQHGVRSLHVAKLMKDYGFKNVSHLKGGMSSIK